MASDFDQLIRELKLVQSRQAGGTLMRKAIPAGASAPVPRLPDMQRLAGRLDLMAKSLGVPKATPAKHQKPNKQEEFLKSLASMGRRIGDSAASGNLTRVQAVEMEARFNTLVEQAVRRLHAVKR